MASLGRLKVRPVADQPLTPKTDAKSTLGIRSQGGPMLTTGSPGSSAVSMAKPFFSDLFDLPPPPVYRPDPQPAMDPGILAQAIKKPGFFDGGGAGGKITSFILEALTGVPSAAHRQQRQDRELQEFGQKSMLQQQLAIQRAQAEQEFKRASPDPTNTQRTYEYLKTIRPDLAEQWLTNQTTAPPLVVPNGDGTRTVYPSGSIPRAPSAVPPQGSPTLPPGYSVRPKGGAPSQGGATFR